MKPLEIVVALTDPPLPMGNAAARWFYVLVRGLHERGHKVTTLVACDNPSEVEESRTLFPQSQYDLRFFQPDQRRGLKAKWRSWNEPYSYRYSDALRTSVRELMRSGADVLHLEHLWSGWIGREFVDQALLNIHYLFEIDLAEDSRSSLEQRLRTYMTSRAERTLLRAYPHIATLTPRLTQRVRELSPGSRVETAPLGFDLGLYPFAPKPESEAGPVVALIGSFNWRPTYSSAERLITKLWPVIRKRRPDAKLMIVGRKAKSALAELVRGLEVELVEDAPDILPYWRKADVLVYAPSRGSGMKVKVLEAMALGVPVVTTTEGVEGLEARDRVHAGISDEDPGLIDRCVEILDDRKLALEMCSGARALVEATCAPQVVLDRFESLYAKIAHGD